MTITRVGTTQKYADGWEKAFGGKRKASASAAAVPASGKPATKKSTRAAAGKSPVKSVKKVAAKKKVASRSPKTKKS